MKLIQKVNLSATLAMMPKDDCCSIPLAMFKESTIRCIACRVGKNEGKKFSVAVTDECCNVTRLS